MFLTSASKFNIEPNGGIFDVSRENDRASPNVKTTFGQVSGCAGCQNENFSECTGPFMVRCGECVRLKVPGAALRSPGGSVVVFTWADFFDAGVKM